MSWCANPQCPRPQDWIGSASHVAAGYGFCNVYHPECCTLAEDGALRDHEHPDALTPNPWRADREEIEQLEQESVQRQEAMTARHVRELHESTATASRDRLSRNATEVRVQVETDMVRAPQAVKLLGGIHEIEEGSDVPPRVGGVMRVMIEAEVTGRYMQGGQCITALRPLVVVRQDG